jgi:DNA-binding phage protein
MSDIQESDQSGAKEEMARLMELLRTIVRLLGFTNRDVERRAGLNHATAVRNFRGEGEPKLEFLLAVVKAVGLDYREFFEIAYPDRREPSDSGQKLQRLLSQFVPTAAARPAGKPPRQAQELEEMLEEMRRDIRALVEKA